MGSQVLGKLRGPWGEMLVALLVVVGGGLGVCRLVGWGAPDVGVHNEVLSRPAHYGLDFSACTDSSLNRWGPRHDYDFVAWSPDGSELYFTDRGDLHGVTANGWRRWLIATAARPDAAVNRREIAGSTSFAVAPDGIHLVYAGCRLPETHIGSDGTKKVRQADLFGFELLRVSRDGRRVERLTESETVEAYPAWSPEGGRIAFLSDTGRTDVDTGASRLSLFTMASDGTDVRQVLGEDFALLHQPPQWSPDGRQLAVIRYQIDRVGFAEMVSQIGRELYVVGADGAEPRRLIADVVSGPSWSPDGQRLAYARADANGVALYTVRSDGTGERQVMSIPQWRGPRFDSKPTEAWIDTVAWSPDGSRILVRSFAEARPIVVSLETGQTTELRIVRSPGDSSFVRDVLAAAWSPDGSRIALVARASTLRGPDIVATVTADGTDVEVLAEKHESLDPRIQWRPLNPTVMDAAPCREGVVVPNPDANPDLVMDCVALAEIHRALERGLSPAWTADRPISDWEGIEIGGSPLRVEALSLRNYGFRGRLPLALGRLVGLRTVELSGNSLWGGIPGELGGLSHLEHLNLRSNQLTGPIPSELVNLTKLRTLNVSWNRLSGDIPRDLADLPNLQEIVLAGNQFTGCVPPGLPVRDRDDLDLPTCEPAT